MFTGIVEERGSVVSWERGQDQARLTVRAPHVHVGAVLGDSVAVNGCCLTVVALNSEQLSFDVVGETLARTNLGAMLPGDPVNLERPLAVNGRLGGHFVQGHIDGVGIVSAVRPQENAVIMDIEIPASLRKYMVSKGSVTLDGVSLTVAEVHEETITVWTIPHTREITTLGVREVGSQVNLECDLLGKYIERLLLDRDALSPATEPL